MIYSYVKKKDGVMLVSLNSVNNIFLYPCQTKFEGYIGVTMASVGPLEFSCL